MKDPFYYGKDLKHPCKLILEVRCKSKSDATNMRMIFIETLRGFKFKPRDYMVEIRDEK